MTKHIGIVAGSSEGAALCYRTICLEAPAVMGEHNHPEITMNSAPMAEHMRHIVRNDWEAAAELLLARLGILGTKYLVEGPVYRAPLEKFRIEREIPDEADRERINEIIFKELVNGIFAEGSRLYLNEVAGKLKERGCDAVVLGCTELPLIVRPDDAPLPTLDSTRLLARAALRKALE